MRYDPLAITQNLIRNTLSYAVGAKGAEYRDFFGEGGYRRPEDYAREIAQMQAERPELVSVHGLWPRTIGGRHLQVVRLRRPGLPEGAPRVLLTALLHAREFIGGESAMDFLGSLVEGRGEQAAALLERCEVDVIPVANPDGVALNMRRIEGRGARFGALHRGNARGVDLNRNFEARYSNLERTYRWRFSDEFSGRRAFSEAESQALKKLVEARGYTAAINLHSYSSVFIVPRFGSDEVDALSEAVARTLPALQPHEPYEVVRGSVFFRQNRAMALLFTAARGTRWVNGTFDDWLMDQGAHALLIEIAKPGFLPEHVGEMALSHLRAFNPSPQDRARAVENVLPAMFAFYHGILDGVQAKESR